MPAAARPRRNQPPVNSPGRRVVASVAVVSSRVHSISGPGGRIATLDEWLEKAPPKRGEAQWRDGRSAKELARAWLAARGTGDVPPEVRALLDSRPETQG